MSFTRHAACKLSYVLFSMPRSGSTTLCRDLNDRGQHCLYELFNFGKNNNGFKWGSALNTSAASARAEPTRYIERVLASSNFSHPNASVPCRVGFKLFPGHAMQPEVAATMATTCIILRRQNTTAQYLSWKRALLLGGPCWGTDPPRQLHCRGRSVSIGADFGNFEEFYARWYSKVAQACAANAVLQLSTEAYLSGRPWPLDRWLNPHASAPTRSSTASRGSEVLAAPSQLAGAA